MRSEKAKLAEQTGRVTNSVLSQQLEQLNYQIQQLREENQEIKQLPMQYNALQKQKPSISIDPMLLKLELDQTRSKKQAIKQKLCRIEEQLSTETKELDKPDSYVQSLIQKQKQLETKLDETTVRLNEATGAKDSLLNVFTKLDVEQLRFDKEIDVGKVSVEIMFGDQQEVMQYVNESEQAKEIAQQELQQVQFFYNEAQKQRESEINKIKAEREKKLGQLISFGDDSDIEEEIKVKDLTQKYIFETYDNLHFENISKFIERVNNQKINRQQHNQHIEKCNKQIQQLNKEQNEIKEQKNEISFNLQYQQQSKLIEQLKNEMTKKQKQFTEIQIKYQTALTQTNNLSRAIQHIIDILCIIKYDLNTVFIDRKLSQEQKIVDLVQRFKCLMDLIGEQVKVKETHNELEDLDFVENYKFEIDQDQESTEPIEVVEIQADLRKQRVEQKKHAFALQEKSKQE